MLQDGEINESDIEDGLINYFGEIESESSCGSDSSMSDGLPMQILHASIPEVLNFTHSQTPMYHT